MSAVFQKLFFNELSILFTVLLFAMKLWNKKSFRGMETKFFWLPVLSCLILAFQDVLETAASQDPTMRFWRILLSVLGYNFRSVAAVGMLLVIVPQEKRKPVLWLPCLLNLLLCCTAFFSDIAFGFDEEYIFYRGPLGIISFIIPISYLILILWNTIRRTTERQDPEKWIAAVCVAYCLTSTYIDATAGGNHLTEAIMVSSVFFYIILYSHDNRLDPLTGLLNRQAFYDDCRFSSKHVRAVVSLDMNGLKELNDTMGHQAGDDALRKIGECIRNNADRNAQAYRTGGDEFMLLLYHDDKEKIASLESQIKEDVKGKGYHVSIGYAMLGQNMDLDGAIRESDRLMYEDKARYYQETGKERRRR